MVAPVADNMIVNNMVVDTAADDMAAVPSMHFEH